MRAEHAEFLELADRLRSMGAVRVRASSYEVVFAEPLRPQDTGQPRLQAPLARSERQELEDLRRRLERDEELG
jgi:hypothetical protein